jgi:hypothetical protein
MTRSELVDRLSRAIAAREGFYVTEAQAKAQKLKYPTLAQRNANPGNIREWRNSRNQPYPQSSGYVDFVAWASNTFPGATAEELSQKALAEGWRVLRKLVGQYLDGKYTGGKVPTLREMFVVYAPASDGNSPEAYAQFVAEKLSVSAEIPIGKLVNA